MSRSSSARASCSTARWLGPLRLLHQRAAVPRGVLHARRHRKGGHRHAAHGRQHAVVHGDVGRRIEGEFRHRRAAWFIHRCRSLRRPRAVGAQLRRDAGGAVDAHARSTPRTEPAGAAGGRPARDPGRRGRPTSIWRRATGPTWPCMNGLLRELFHHGWIDEQYVQAHTIGVEELQQTVDSYTLEHVARICDVRADGRRGCRRARRHVRSAAQHRLARHLPVESGDGGRLPGEQHPLAARHARSAGRRAVPDERPADSPEHPRDGRRRRPARACGTGATRPTSPSWPACGTSMQRPSRTGPHRRTRCRSSATPSRARSNCCGSRRPTRPCRCRTWPAIRRILSQPELFVVVQDLFLTETAQLADVVLPAAAWGEKIGTFTNADRTVHLSERAVDPPGEARTDLDIFLDYAGRMGFHDRDGNPLITGTTPSRRSRPGSACSRGRPCDYSGLTLRPAARQRRASSGRARRHARGHGAAVRRRRLQHRPRDCESYGNDLTTGAAFTADEYRAKQPRGRAFLHAADYVPAPEEPTGAIRCC